MKCSSCNGRLEGNMTVCPYCGTRQGIDLKKIHFRDLGTNESLPCPDCKASLNVIEFDTDPKIQIERCDQCHGMFFNPGELEALIESNTHDFVWLDKERIQGIAENYGYNHEVVYLKCPVCQERMSHINFGGSSGVILDRCGKHGVWVQGGELRRLMEWWSAGGKHIHQQNEQGKVARLNDLKLPPMGSDMGSRRLSKVDRPQGRGSTVHPPVLDDGGRWFDGWDVFAAVCGLLASILD